MNEWDARANLIIPFDIENVRIVPAHVDFGRADPKHEAMTYPKYFEKSELVAVVEITPDAVTYYWPWIHTLYKARVIRLIKGSAPDIIDIYQLDGYHYHPKGDFLVLSETDPLLKPGERWLFFMRRWDMKDGLKAWKLKYEDLPHGDVYVASFDTCLKLEDDGKLYSFDNYNKVWSWRRKRYGGYEEFHVEGVTVEAFIKRISQKT